jgi:hypothetical protein
MYVTFLMMILIPLGLWFLFKYFLAIAIGAVTIAIIFASPNAHAQTVNDPAYANMQRAVGGIVNQHVATNGYASADPRVYQTLRSMGTAAVSGVVAAGAGVLLAGSSIAWGSVLAIAVVGSAISYGVTLGLDQLTKWIFSNNGVTPVVLPTDFSSAQLVNGSIAACMSGSSGTCAATSDQLTAYQIGALCSNNGWQFVGYSSCGALSCPAGSPTSMVCIGYMNGSIPLIQLSYIPVKGVYSGVTCPAGQVTVSGNCSSMINYASTSKIPLATAVSGLTAHQLAQPVDYSTMALMINKLWKDAAAQSGYQGVPYDALNPVTSTEVQAFAIENPSSYPTVAALTAPIGSAGSTAVTAGLSPSTTVSSTTPVTPAVSANPATTTVIAPASPTTDLGVDPNIRFLPPVAPTAQSILDPILNMLPGWRSATFTATGTCPRPVINFSPFMQLVVTMDSHCNLIEENRALISSIMSGVWLLIAALIVLTA